VINFKEYSGSKEENANEREGDGENEIEANLSSGFEAPNLNPPPTFGASCTSKHPSHVRHPDIPLTNVSTELRCSMKHPSHIRHISHIPEAGGNNNAKQFLSHAIV
jgi:hypothetical protein